MKELLLDGFTYAEIGKKSGVSRQRVQQILSPPKNIRDYVFSKFERRCFYCGIYVGTRGHIHHDIDNGLEYYEDKDNLVLLCVSCHRRTHGKDNNGGFVNEMNSGSSITSVIPVRVPNEMKSAIKDLASLRANSRNQNYTVNDWCKWAFNLAIRDQKRKR